MDPAMQSAIITAIATLLGVVVGVLPTYLIARTQHKMELDRFYSQRWWEKKEEAYSHIIEQLSYLQYYYGKWLESLELHGDFDDEYERQLREGYRQAKEEIEKAAAAGAHIVSDDAASALEEFLRSLYRVGGPNLYENLDVEYGLVRHCIARVRECARTDLKGK